jgi:DNA polymerase-1
MSRVTLFDIETDGFLDVVTKIHCLSIKNPANGKTRRFTAVDMKEGVELLMKLGEQGKLVGHNIIPFDIPVIQKLYPWFKVPRENVVDTLVMSRLFFSDMFNRDGGHIAAGRLPSKLLGSHKLEAWGYRLGLQKGEYSIDFKEAMGDAYEPGMEWAEYSPAMGDYCDLDVEVTEALYNHLMKLEYSSLAIDLEHKARHYCSMMERSGWPFDVEAAAALYAKLAGERDAIRQKMIDTFPPLVIERYSDKTGKRLKDKVIEFNPGSRTQIAQRLQAKYGWKPTEFTDKGKPKIDETILKKLPYDEAQVLASYFLLEKRVGQLAEGDEAWLKAERKGHIHGSINTCGAVTGRCTHAHPNIAQVPSVRALWGKECRGLWGVRPGFRQLGADLSGLELRCLAHFMAKWDDGAYGRILLEGDVHTANQEAAGLPTRDNAKTFIYGFLYGAGDEKIGSIIGKGRKEGKAIKEKFLAGLPALGNLKRAVESAAKRGHLIGLDGRRVTVRSPHAALNTLLQGAGALISKQWVIEVMEEAEHRGYRYGWDGDFTMLGYIHDEIQFAVREGLEDEFGPMVLECARKAGEFFKFRCPIAAEYKVGNNWADCH